MKLQSSVFVPIVFFGTIGIALASFPEKPRKMLYPIDNTTATEMGFIAPVVTDEMIAESREEIYTRAMYTPEEAAEILSLPEMVATYSWKTGIQNDLPDELWVPGMGEIGAWAVNSRWHDWRLIPGNDPFYSSWMMAVADTLPVHNQAVGNGAPMFDQCFDSLLVGGDGIAANGDEYNLETTKLNYANGGPNSVRSWIRDEWGPDHVQVGAWMTGGEVPDSAVAIETSDNQTSKCGWLTGKAAAGGGAQSRSVGRWQIGGLTNEHTESFYGGYFRSAHADGGIIVSDVEGGYFEHTSNYGGGELQGHTVGFGGGGDSTGSNTATVRNISDVYNLRAWGTRLQRWGPGQPRSQPSANHITMSRNFNAGPSHRPPLVAGDTTTLTQWITYNPNTSPLEIANQVWAHINAGTLKRGPGQWSGGTPEDAALLVFGNTNDASAGDLNGFVRGVYFSNLKFSHSGVTVEPGDNPDNFWTDGNPLQVIFCRDVGVGCPAADSTPIADTFRIINPPTLPPFAPDTMWNDSLETYVIDRVGYNQRLDSLGNMVSVRSTFDDDRIAEFYAGTGLAITPDMDTVDIADPVAGISCRDNDNDAMCDAWEEANGLNSSDGTDGADDPDGDGRPNYWEWHGGDEGSYDPQVVDITWYGHGAAPNQGTQTPDNLPDYLDTVRAYPGRMQIEGEGAATFSRCDRSNIKVHRVTSNTFGTSGTIQDILENWADTTQGDTMHYVVFDIGGHFTPDGVLELSGTAGIPDSSTIGCIYVAGQTAPGDGMWINGAVTYRDFIFHDVGVRGLTLTPTASIDVFNANQYVVQNCEDCFVSNMSFSFGANDILETSHHVPGSAAGAASLSPGLVRNTTFQWNMIGPGALDARGGGLKGDTDPDLEDCGRQSWLNTAMIESIRRNPEVRCGGGFPVEVRNIYSYNNTDMGRLSQFIDINFVNAISEWGPSANCQQDRHVTFWQITSPIDSNQVFLDRTIGITNPGCITGGFTQDTVRQLWGSGSDTTVYHYSIDVNTVDSSVHRAETPHVMDIAETFPAVMPPLNLLKDAILDSAGNQYGLSCEGVWTNRTSVIDSVNKGISRSGGTEGSSGTSQLYTGRADWESDYSVTIGTPSAGSACADTDTDGLPNAYEDRIGPNTTWADADSILADGNYNVMDAYLAGLHPDSIGEVAPPVLGTSTYLNIVRVHLVQGITQVDTIITSPDSLRSDTTITWVPVFDSIDFLNTSGQWPCRVGSEALYVTLDTATVGTIVRDSAVVDSIAAAWAGCDTSDIRVIGN